MQKKQRVLWIAVSVAIAVTALFFFSFFGQLVPPFTNSVPTNVDTFTMPENETDFINTTEISVGTGAEALPGSSVTVHYTGTLADGTVFDSSVSRGEPFEFQLGVGRVIRGWDKGLVGMKEGGKRRIVIQPEYAYGERGVQNPQTGEYIIPQNAVLTFEVELLEVSSSAQ